MNILYISKQSVGLQAGPTYSVPAQIRAQSKIDHVLWYNLTEDSDDMWTNGICYKNLSDYPTGRLSALPEPFNCPDLAVLEGVYSFPFCPIIFDLYKAKIPYVIVPRGSLTELAQKKRGIKKIVGNALFFNWMVRHATAIQYLTEEERDGSVKRWPVDHFVIPNGINAPGQIKNTFSEYGIKITYIGRLEQYQKGLDLLLAAITQVKDELRRAGVTFELYGPNRGTTVQDIEETIKKEDLYDIASVHPEIFKEDKAKVLLNTDVFIMTSRFEGLPMGMLEALSYGLPCVATTGTNMRHMINKFDAGWTAENEAGSIAHMLLQVVEEKGQLSTKGKNAMELASIYQWDKLAQQSHIEFEKIVG